MMSFIDFLVCILCISRQDNLLLKKSGFNFGKSSIHPIILKSILCSLQLIQVFTLRTRNSSTRVIPDVYVAISAKQCKSVTFLGWLLKIIFSFPCFSPSLSTYGWFVLLNIILTDIYVSRLAHMNEKKIHPRFLWLNTLLCQWMFTWTEMYWVENDASP